MLTVDKIMSEKFLGTSPSEVRWSLDGSKLYFMWRPVSEEKKELYEVSIEGGEPRKLTKDEKKWVQSFTADYNEDHSMVTYEYEDNIYLLSQMGGIPIMDSSDKSESPKFTHANNAVVYKQGSNLFKGLQGGGIVQLSCFKPEKEKEKEKTENQKWVAEEETKFFDLIRKRVEEEEEKKEGKPESYYLKENESIKDFHLSHDEKNIVFTLVGKQKKAIKPIVPDFVTKTGYTIDIETRLKVGDKIDSLKLGVQKVETGEVRWVDHEQGEKEIELKFLEWSPDGSKAILSALTTDFKDHWFLYLDPVTGKTEELTSMHNEAWIKWSNHDAGFLSDNEIYYLSEADGWLHLYRMNLKKRKPVQVTKGEYEVSNPRLSRDKSTLYVDSSEDDLGERHLYSFDTKTWEKTKISSMEGKNEAWLSHDETKIALLHSYSNKPTELYVMENKPGAEARQLTDTPSSEWKNYPWIEPEIIHFTARDGVKVRARLYKPEGYTGAPAVQFVHGAGYLQNVHKWWSSYFREYMFHHLLMERGYAVLDIDYRASAGYGANWRTSIYRYMGDLDLKDQIDGAKYLVEEHGADPERLGIYGGSYGGFITLMALFTDPDVFKAGASLRPVTDWAHYNHSYTGRILNLPQDDPEAFIRSSPIYHAEGLKNHLLICHGMVDTNVHFQDTVRLAQRLIELRKENWEVAIYPVENHGFTEETSWADEYKRILKLYETVL